jgi:hypothetical protein
LRRTSYSRRWRATTQSERSTNNRRPRGGRAVKDSRDEHNSHGPGLFRQRHRYVCRCLCVCVFVCDPLLQAMSGLATSLLRWRATAPSGRSSCGRIVFTKKDLSLWLQGWNTTVHFRRCRWPTMAAWGATVCMCVLCVCGVCSVRVFPLCLWCQRAGSPVSQARHERPRL